MTGIWTQVLIMALYLTHLSQSYFTFQVIVHSRLIFAGGLMLPITRMMILIGRGSVVRLRPYKLALKSITPWIAHKVRGHDVGLPLSHRYKYWIGSHQSQNHANWFDWPQIGVNYSGIATIITSCLSFMSKGKRLQWFRVAFLVDNLIGPKRQ